MDVTTSVPFERYEDIKQIIFQTLTEHPYIDDNIETLLCAEVITERIISYLQAEEGIPT